MDKKALIKALRDTVQSASNSVASGVSAPVDLIAAGLRKVGVPIPQAPVGGSQWMENMGLTVPVEDGIPKLAGETLGMIVPMAATAKAPQIASAANRGLENLAAPRTLNTPGYGGQRGAIVWHGSPHKFDAFDASKIGTGEGAQAYGHGMYFAESPDVAKEYQKALSNNLDARKLDDVRYAWNKSGVEIDAYPSRNNEINLSRIVVDKSKRNQGLGTAAMQDLIQYADDTGKTIKLSPSTDFGGTSVNRLKDFYKRLGFVENKGKNKDFTISELMYKRPETRGALYKVDLPDEAIARMLDWDKPLSQQAQVVSALRPVSERVPGLSDTLQEFELGSTTGQAVNNYISKALSPADAARLLKDAGIPGIRYLDAASRATGGTSNFVVFPGEERLLRILERNNQPMGLMGAPKQTGLQELTTLNPTGSVFSNYDPISRAIAPLGKNITTLDKTMGGLADDTVTIYRGAPKTQKTINPGDFITTDAQLARDYAGTGHVISQKVRKKDILDDMLEPLGGEYIYRPAK